MYVPHVDRARDDVEWRAFVESQGFGHLAACGGPGEPPVLTPTQFVLEGDEVLLHVAGANPMVAALEQRPDAVLAVAGDWAFVPSNWKAIDGEDPARGIPTTYYAAVQLAGRAEVLAAPAAIAALLRRQLGALQPGVEVADPEAAHPQKLGSIRGVVLHVERVTAKFKFGGNVDEAHRRSVVARLEDRSRPGDRAAAQHARRRISTLPEGTTAFRR